MQNEIDLNMQNAKGFISCSFTPKNVISPSCELKLSQCDQIIYSFYLYDLAICISQFLVEKDVVSLETFKTTSQQIIKGYDTIFKQSGQDIRFIYWCILFTLISFILQVSKDEKSETHSIKSKCLILFEKLFELNESVLE